MAVYRERYKKLFRALWIEKHKREDDTDTQLLWIYNQNKEILHDMFSTDCLDQNDLDHLKERLKNKIMAIQDKLEGLVEYPDVGILRAGMLSNKEDKD